MQRERKQANVGSLIHLPTSLTPVAVFDGWRLHRVLEPILQKVVKNVVSTDSVY